MTIRASCSTVIGFENGISDLVIFETKIRSIRLPPKASADPGFQRLGTYVHKSPYFHNDSFHGPIQQDYLPFVKCPSLMLGRRQQELMRNRP